MPKVTARKTVVQNDLFSSFELDNSKDTKPSLVHKASEADLSFRGADTNYLTHDFHTYPAKFIPQLVTWLMQKYSKPRQTILDPFVGSGTTLVEALLNDRNGLGVEISPVGRLVSMAKTTPIPLESLTESKSELYRNINRLLNKYLGPSSLTDRKHPNLESFDLWFPKFENYEKWFLPEVIVELAIIKEAIETLTDKKFKVLSLVAFSSIVKSVSNARTDERNPKLRKELRSKPQTIKVFKNRLERMTSNISEFTKLIHLKSVRAKIVGKDARKLNIDDSTVDLVITSPPYAYAIDYVRMHKLSLYWVGESDLTKLDAKFVGTERVYAQQYSSAYSFPNSLINNAINRVKETNKKKAYVIYKYFVDMQTCLQEMYRVLKKKGKCAIVIGDSNVQSIHIPTHEFFNEISKDIGYKVKDVLIREIPFENKGLANVHSEFGGEMVQQEYINIIEK